MFELKVLGLYVVAVEILLGTGVVDRGVSAKWLILAGLKPIPTEDLAIS